MDLGIKDQVAMVAGGSKGLGYAVAKILAAEGAHVSIASRSADHLHDAQRGIAEVASGSFHTYVADVARPDDLTQWKEDVVTRYGRIDMLFVNSGGPPAGMFASFDDAAWYSAVDLLLMSAIRMTRLVLPVMQQQGSGSILMTTSSSVKEPIDNLTLSNVVRPSVTALAKVLSKEYAKDHIRVNHIFPGRIDTDRVRELDTINAGKKKITPEEQKKIMSAAIPMGRYGEADEFARAAVFLLSPAASYITGATLQVDGGTIKSVM